MNSDSTLLWQIKAAPAMPPLTLLDDANITAISNESHGRNFDFAEGITGSGQLTFLGANNQTHQFSVANPGWSGGLVTGVGQNARTRFVAAAEGSLGTGDVTIGASTDLRIDDNDGSGGGNAIDDAASLSLNGSGRDQSPAVKLIMDGSDTVNQAFIDTLPLPAGTYGSIGTAATVDNEVTWIEGPGVLTVLSVAADSTPPQVAAIESPPAMSPIFGTPTIPYTVTFDEDIDAATVDAADFVSIGNAPFSIGAITKTSVSPLPAVFTIEVIPGGAGTVQLQIPESATISDTAGNALATPVDDDVVYTLDTSPQPSKETITIVGSAEGSGIGGGGDKTLVTGFDASSGDKLVVVVGGEHGNPQSTGGQFNSMTYNGVSMTRVVHEEAGIPTAAIFYLDDPAAASPGDIVVNQGNHNGTCFGVYLLSGTAPGVGIANKSTSDGVGLITSASQAMVIAGVLNAGPDGGNGASNMAADPPLTEDTQSDLTSGNRWVSFSFGSAIIASPVAETYSFSGAASNHLLATVAVEIPAAASGGGTDPYDTWAGGFTGLADPGPEIDFDGGGLPTGIEWVVGGDPTNPNDDPGLAPSIDNATSPGNLLFVFRRTTEAGADANTAIVVEYGSDLVGWTPAVDAVDGVSVVTETDGFGAGVDKVTVSLPQALASDGKLFARLNVQIATP